MDKGLMQVKEKLSKELVGYAMGLKDITNANLDTIYKTTKSIYYLTTMEAMGEYSGNDSYSMDYSGRRMSYGRAGRDGDSDGRYSEAMNRSMDSYGSYNSYGYSGHDAKEHMVQDMKRMMNDLEPADRMAVQQCIERMQVK